MFLRYKAIGLLVSLAFVVGMLGACGPKPPPQAGEINVEPSTTILVGETASLTITASGQDLQFEWTVSRGRLSSSTTPSVLYTAPDSSGPDTVTVKVTSKGGSTVRSITFKVEPLPISTSTLTPTAAPTEPSPPTPTATPTFTLTPVPPLTEIFPQSESYGEAFYWAANGGELTYRYVESEGCRHTGTFGLQLVYAMSGEGNGGWGVNWANAPSGGFDASEFSALVFWVKGTSGGETFLIGLKDTSGNEVRVDSQTFVVISASEWRLVIAPLNEFRDEGVNITSVENVNFGFHAAHGSGSICIDDIAFE